MFDYIEFNISVVLNNWVPGRDRSLAQQMRFCFDSNNFTTPNDIPKTASAHQKKAKVHKHFASMP
jgi:hypothetical protein